ncbi:DUF3347 domain-containing protein [Chryseobacterium chendengshani]|uniref:DUF3347 domain-containing protein n=1 Tax=unclassified Chryseobacterium TaxID=2593645 RepID=UPI001C643783|nr:MULTISPECIES: DUF3347 domain-containing protein [unclassified Chryseobacterium]MBW7674574.1 DUF3347 domain-containing protein [Chryseobacterium sp. LJ756]MBW8522634.1 DUF3347 domain-containing protein [Chryseobacterium sp. LJ668]QYK16171.1 DUF3347 domain-containing protein [Chryseobacterium sp. LJ668]
MKKYIALLFSVIMVITLQSQSKQNTQLTKLYQNYIAIKSSLSSDDLKKTSMAAGEFLKTAKTVNAKMITEKKLISLKADATTIAQGKNIETQRKAFYQLSDIMISLAKENKLSDKTIFVQYCPMAKGSWMSNEKQIVNPYYGKSMLDCGSVKSEIK